MSSSLTTYFVTAVRDKISTLGMTSNSAVILVIAGLVVLAALMKRSCRPIRSELRWREL